MFFTTLNPLLIAGAKIKIEITASPQGEIAFDVHPIPKAGQALLAKRFTGTAEELDAGIRDILQAFTTSNITVADQIAAMDVLAKAAVKEVSEAKPASKPAVKTVVQKPRNSAPAGLLEADDGDDEPPDTDADKPTPSAAQAPVAEQVSSMQFTL